MYDATLKQKKMSISLTDLTQKVDKNLYCLIELAIPIFLRHLQKVEKIPTTHQIEFSLTLCGKERMKKINYKHRKKNKSTDVLSFPFYEDIKELRSKKSITPIHFLGDIVICKEIAKKQAKEFKITYEEETMHLLVHGFLHLIGYDHERSLRDEILMEKLEAKETVKILKRIKNGRKS